MIWRKRVRRGEGDKEGEKKKEERKRDSWREIETETKIINQERDR